MGIKLLLADDSITIQKVVGIIFSREDYELTIVDNGNAALAKAKETRPDLLLVDAVMPGLTGYEVCEQVRSNPALQTVPILLLTGAFDPFDEEKARNSGADDYISKPFESQNLIDKVTTLLDLGRRREAAPQPAAAAPSIQAPPEEKPVMPPPPQPAAVAAPPVPPSVAPLVEETPAAVAEPFAMEILEGTADDDLWGAFELEEVAEGEEGEFGEVYFGDEHEPFATEVMEEPYSFAEEPETAAQPSEFVPKWEPAEEEAFSFQKEEEAAAQSFEAAPEEGFELFERNAGLVEAAADEPSEFFAEFAEPAVAQQDQVVSAIFSPEFAPKWEPAEEEAFSFQGEEEVAAQSFEAAPEEGFELFEGNAGLVEAAADEPSEYFAEFAEPEVAQPGQVVTATSSQGFDLEFAPEEEYVPVLEKEPAVIPAAAAVSTPPADIPLSEEQLASLVSRISRDIIEKIAWEVVPDLAERIIKDEIQKIKDGR